MFTEKFALALGLVLIGCGTQAGADIVGGIDVNDSDPIRASTVSLYTPLPNGRGGSLCTASIIAKDIAVTAAHCIQPNGPKPVVLFGRDLRSAQTVKRQAVASVVNSNWSRHHGRGMDQGDIALVRFPGGLPAGYHRVATAKSDTAIVKGRPAILAGYGISDARTRSGSGILRKTDVRIANPRKGKSEMILDQSHGRGACHGDSGGPAFVQSRGKSILAGVTNRSYPSRAPDDCGHQVVYTKVAAYRDWIKKSEKSLRSRPLLLQHKFKIKKKPKTFAARKARW